MALIKYKEVLALAKEKVKEVMAPLRAREMCKKAELEICKLDSSIVEKEQKIQESLAEYPINFDRLIDTMDELELLKRRKDQFDKIIKEVFSD